MCVWGETLSAAFEFDLGLLFGVPGQEEVKSKAADKSVPHMSRTMALQLIDDVVRIIETEGDEN